MLHIGDHSADPRSKVALQSDAYAARYKSVLEGLGITCVQHQSTFALRDQFHLVGRQARMPFSLTVSKLGIAPLFMATFCGK